MLPKLHLFLLTLTCIILESKEDCPLSYLPPKTTTSIIEAEIDNAVINPSGVHRYQHPLLHELPSGNVTKVVVGVYKLELYKNSQELGFSINAEVQPEKKTSIEFILVTQNTGNLWQFVTFSFLASEAQEFLLGIQNSVISDTSLTVKSITHGITFPKVDFGFVPKVKIFISGFQITQLNQTEKSIHESIEEIEKMRGKGWSNEIVRKTIANIRLKKLSQLEIVNPKFAKNGQISFQLLTYQISIQSFSFSYLVYLERTSENIYHTIGGNFEISGIENFFYDNLNSGVNKLLGVTSLKIPYEHSIISLVFSSEKYQTQNYFKAQVSSPNEFTIEYFGIEVLPGSVCRSCPGSPLIFSQFCVRDCPTGYVSSINKDGAWLCHKCEIETLLIAGENRTSCVCAKGHYLIAPQMKCEACPYHCLTCNGNICLNCDTEISSTFRTLNTNTGKCECPSIGYYDDSQRMLRSCIRCDTRCRTCLGPNITQCTSCTGNRILREGICQCTNNFVQNEHGDCVCLSPYSMNSQGQCVLLQNQCNVNETLSISGNGQRTCNCISGYARSPVSNKCLKSCEINEKFNPATEQCDCVEGFVRENVTSPCISCSSKLNQFYNPLSSSCECMQGFELNRRGECSSCPLKTLYNSQTDTCECIFNYYRKLDGSCAKCTSENDHPSCVIFGGEGTLEL